MSVTVQASRGGIGGSTGATDNRLLRADGTGGATLQSSAVTVDDSGNMSGVGTLIAGATTIASASSSAPLTVQFTDDGAGSGPIIVYDRASVSPAASDLLGGFYFNGRDSDGGGQSYARVMAVIISPTSAAENGRLRLQTVLAGVIADRMLIAGGVYHSAATGGDKGDNTINFGAVYDDNTLLTCYVFDAALDGLIEDAKWDAKVPDRRIEAVKDETGKVVAEARIEPRIHKDMRKFRARLGGTYDPLDVDKYTQHWKDKRHLSSLPNETTFDPVAGLPTGAWIQRLVETVEIQAIHIASLNDRIKALETVK